MFLPTHLHWAQDKVSGVEHVTLENFVKEFNLSDRQSATDTYTALIGSDEIRRQRREKLQEAFKEFRKHQEDFFWSRRKLQLSSEITSNEAAADLQEAAVKKSRKGYLEVSCHPLAGLKHSRDLIAELDETLPKIARNACKCILKQRSTQMVAFAKPYLMPLFGALSCSFPHLASRPSSELVRTPLQSPASSEPASPIRPLILSTGYGGAETVITNETIQNHGDDADTVFIGPSEHEQREYLLQALHAGEQLPRNCGRPDYVFTLPLGGKDWGPQMTRTYDATRQKAGLTFQDLNEIAYVLLPS